MFCLSKFASTMAVIQISLLLALSFFVLLSIGKAGTKRLKVFGYVVAVILWLAILAIILGGVTRLTRGGDQAKYMMHKMMMQNGPMMNKEKAAVIPAGKGCLPAQGPKAKEAGR